MFKTAGKTTARHRLRATKVMGVLAIASLAVGSCLSIVGTASGASPVTRDAPSGSGSDDEQQPVAKIKDITRDAMKQYNLKSIIVQVMCGGKNIYTGALGESMTGVPATPAMHFRNGAMAFTYMSTLLLELIDEKPAEVNLNDKLGKFLPGLPDANRISLKNLANMTSGYADYVYTPEVLRGTSIEPFRQWTSEELIQIGISKRMMFAPGTNWGYSHTNYVILGRVIEKITGMSLADAMRKYIFDRMDLKQTRSSSTPQIPEPVLHAFSSEQRADLLIPPGTPFYEESTFWNPSWTTAEGAVQTTDITDMSKSMEAVGAGKVLSRASWAAQVGPNLVGFGHRDPNCPVCRQNTSAFNYGLGVVNVGPWITQTKNFAGSGATVGYFPWKRLTVSVVTTYGPDAFDDKGTYTNASMAIFASLGNALAPNTVPKLGP